MDDFDMTDEEKAKIKGIALKEFNIDDWYDIVSSFVDWELSQMREDR